MSMENLVTGGSLWGFNRVVQRKGNRVLAPIKPGAEYIPNKVRNILDIDINTVGQVLSPNLEDWTLIFVYSKGNSSAFEPPNGSNCAVFVPRRKILIPCGRVIRVK